MGRGGSSEGPAGITDVRGPASSLSPTGRNGSSPPGPGRGHSARSSQPEARKIQKIRPGNRFQPGKLPLAPARKANRVEGTESVRPVECGLGRSYQRAGAGAVGLCAARRWQLCWIDSDMPRSGWGIPGRRRPARASGPEAGSQRVRGRASWSQAGPAGLRPGHGPT